MTANRRARSTGLIQLGSGQNAGRDFSALGSSDSPPCGSGKSKPIQQAKNPILDGLSEREFQRLLVAGLQQRGFTVWTVPNMKLTTAGLPDVLAIHPDWDRLLVWELKRERDYRVTPAQRASLDILGRIPGVDARVVRPSEWPGLAEWIDARRALAGCAEGETNG